MYLVDFALFFSVRENINKKKRLAILFAVILVVAAGERIVGNSLSHKENGYFGYYRILFYNVEEFLW